MKASTRKLLAVPLFILLAVTASRAAIDVVPPGGGGGTDGVLDPSVDDAICVGGLTGGICEIDLALAACDCSGSPPGSRTVCPAEGSPDRCTWNGTNPSDDDPSGTVGNGVYDGDQWAVVFRFSSVNIQSGVTVQFRNHPSRAPVVWLVDGSVTIAGTVDVSGGTGGAPGTNAEPGPGGFRGGQGQDTGTPWGMGFGPGGGVGGGGGGSYGTVGGVNPGPDYGNDRVIPLIGGSGASGHSHPNAQGGAGGGAILIATDGAVTVDGAVYANGGAGAFVGGYTPASGSGGAIRILAETIDGDGVLRAQGINYTAGVGRIRLEPRTGPLTLNNTAPAHTAGSPCAPPAAEGCAAEIWPEDLLPSTQVPTVRISQIAGTPSAADPRARFEYPTQDLRILDPDPVVVTIEAVYVPATWNVSVRVTPRNGDYIVRCAVETDRVGDTSTWEASVAFPNAFSAVQVRASQDTCTPVN